MKNFNLSSLWVKMTEKHYLLKAALFFLLLLGCFTQGFAQDFNQITQYGLQYGPFNGSSPYLGETYGQDANGLYVDFYVCAATFNSALYVTDGQVSVSFYSNGTQKTVPIFRYNSLTQNVIGTTYPTNGVEIWPSNTGESALNTGIEARAFNSGDGTWSGYLSYNPLVPFPVIRYDGGSDYQEAIVRWYIPGQLAGQYISFKDVVQYQYVNGSNGTATINLYGNYYNFSNAYNPTFTYAPSKTPGKMTVTYKYNGSVPSPLNSYYITHWMDNDEADSIADNASFNATGSLDVDMNNYPQNHPFVTQYTTAAGIKYLQYSSTFVPAYSWPTTLSAKYDGRDTVNLQWQVPDLQSYGYNSNDAITGDNFEVDRSTDSTFATNVTTVANYPYNFSTGTYSVVDNLSNITGGTKVYYRLRRTQSESDWEWKVERTANASVAIEKNQVVDTAVLTQSNGSPQATITWQPFQGVWTQGTTFTLIKSNKTTGAQAATINLTEPQARSGQYVDQGIPYCNDFTYSIQVTLGGGYASPAIVQVPGDVLAVDIGSISDLTTSKGYFPDHVNLQWSSQGEFDDYIVERKVYGDSASHFVQIATVPGTSTNTLQTTDATGQPGVYYEYMVVGAVKCNNETRYSKDSLYAIGFRSPTGNIYGRVTYSNGQAVQNVTVRLQNDDNPQLGYSILLNGQDSSYLVVDSLHSPFVDSAFTVSAWIDPSDPTPTNQVLFSQQGQYELGFDGNGQLYFTYNNQTVTGPYLNPNHGWVHVAGIHNMDSLTLMVNDSVIATMAVPFSVPSTVSPTVYIGRDLAGNNYKGYIDEMRVWNVAETPQQIALNYTRLLTGGEPGLAAYWRFDETIADQFYDISYQSQSNTYNQNDGTMNPNYVSHSIFIPSADQLSLKAYTDSSGNYMIKGIPYSGNGTTYTVVPLFETHQFSPASANRLISGSSSTYDVNFTDNSSFPVTGFVYYFNSSVPVPGVEFLIDGKYAQAGDGTLLQTDATGKFSISVPVGYHEVKAVLNNHVFELGGKITDQFGNDLNYQAPVGPVTLFDSTTIRFIGRVAGGAVQEAYPLGHSLSRNNLGAQLEITLQLPSGTRFNLYNGNASDSTVFVDHLLPSSQTDSSKIHKTRVVYDRIKDQIDIYPDSLTGEFEANLIPVQFIAQSATATGWGNILPSPVSLDFRNAFIPQYSVYNYEDSSQANSGTWSYTQYKDTVVYSSSYQFIKRVTPTVNVLQLSPSGKPVPYFGDTAYVYQTLAGGNLNIPLVNNSDTGRSQYLLGDPVMTQNKPYQFEIKASEQYPFYTGVKLDGTPIPATQNGQPVVDNVPTTDGTVSVYDNISNGAVQPDTLSLDSTGTGYYNFVAGDPEIQAPGTKNFAVSVKFGQATNVNWSWIGNPQLQAYVLGGKLSGTDFVTAGPNKVLMVLRDPPGNNSYSYLQSGSTVTSSSTYTGTVDQTGDETLVTDIGTKLVTFVGLGGGVINSVTATNGITVGVHHEEHYTGTDTKTNTTTFTTGFQTSSDPGFVGALADLYVGYSTNITYGLSNNLVVIPRTDYQAASDALIYQASATSPYLVVERQGLNFGQSFGTLFAYPQQYIVNTLIPHLVNIRNNFLLPSSSITPAQAQGKANTDNTPVYVSKLAPTDPDFGKSNDDTTAFGSKAKTDPFGNGESYTIYFPQSSLYRTDTILILNEYVQDWKNQIAENEKEKLNATLIQNYSFHAGSPIDYSETADYNHDQSNSFNFVLSASIVNSIDTKFNGAGAEFDINESLGTQQGGSFENSTDTTTTMGFELAAGGADEYLSVDVDKASDGGFTFKTKGGATGCPYEPATTTQYYQPGTVIDQPTVQLEVPKISVENPVVNNVPSTQTASFTLHLGNESQEQQAAGNFTLEYANTDSVQGATIAVDGSSIADGRSYSIPSGQPLTVVLTLAKGPNAMNYNNIPIILTSSCDGSIADTVLISAHFVPSCSNVNVASPNSNWVVNTISPVDQQGNPYLPVTLNNFDESNNLFDHIELQYKPSQNSQWITAMSFYPDSAAYNAAQGQKALITNAQGINYNLSMNAATFNDGPYDVRALAVCQLSPGQYISTPSNIASGIKDVSAPVLFGSPQPANGILGIGDNVELTFDKQIAGGLLNPTDFQVTGIRNGTPGDHSVSINLDGKSDYAVSEFNKNFTGRSFTAEMWVLPDSIENGTVFSQGNINQSIELAFTNDSHLQVIVGKKVIESPKPLNYLNGQWSHVALEYNAVDSTVSAFYNFQEVISQVSVNSYTGTGPLEFGRSISLPNGNYFSGKMQNARIWTQDVSVTALQLNSLTRLSGSENALLSYYPMDEGNGNILLDKAHGNNMQLTGTWSMPPGKAIALSGSGYVKINTGTIPITSGMNYTLGLWFKGQPGQTNAALLSNGRGDGMDGSGSKNLFYLGFENGQLTFENNGFEVQLDSSNYLDNQWHHVAVAVNRISGVGQMFVDGQMKKYFNAQNLGGIAAPYMYTGARVWYDSTNAVTPHIDQYFMGNIDEVRIWNSYLNQSVLDNLYNTRLNGDELGLLAYYPFDTYIQFQGQPYLNFTLSDEVIDSNYLAPDADTMNVSQTDASAPIKNRGPVANLNFNYVYNNNALIINLLEPPQAVDKTIVTFKVKGAQDMDGNTMQSPVIWTAYIDQNPLKWGDDELNLTMKVDTPIQFTSYINNSSGSNQNFRIDNLPGWLTASPSSGTIGPEGKQLITFTVNQGLNVGSYSDIAEMINDNNETQGLTVNLTVQGHTPDWKVNPADFKYNMTVFGKIREDGIFSSNPGDVLAAFANGKCVGVAYNTYSSATDLWYAFLTIYSDSIRYNNLEFRIWDAGNGKIYEGIPSMPVPFVNDTVIGAPLNPVIFDGKEMMFNNLALNQGWNWISFNLYNPNLSDINTTLQNGNWQSGDIVKNNDMGFDQYSMSSGWVGYLNGFNNISMFMLQTANAQTVSVSGTPVDVTKTGISLKGNRWNYISYLPQGNMTVKEALAGYEASNGDIIKSQTGFDMYAAPNGWVGNLTYMEPGKGYMLFRTAATDTTFYYPNLPGILGVAIGNNSPQDHNLLNGSTVAYNANPDQIPVAGNFGYAHNMTMVAVTGKEFRLLPGDKIQAFSGDELIGEAKAISNPITKATSYFMNIGGDQSKQVTFKIERNGEVAAVSSSMLDYARNMEIGTPESPYVIHFKPVLSGVSVFPNPFSEHLNIYAKMDTRWSAVHTIQISVYDAGGKLVYQNTPVSFDGTVYNATWDGRGNNGLPCSPGIYFVNINIDGIPHTSKVFKY